MQKLYKKAYKKAYESNKTVATTMVKRTDIPGCPGGPGGPGGPWVKKSIKLQIMQKLHFEALYNKDLGAVADIWGLGGGHPQKFKDCKNVEKI